MHSPCFQRDCSSSDCCTNLNQSFRSVRFSWIGHQFSKNLSVYVWFSPIQVNQECFRKLQPLSQLSRRANLNHYSPRSVINRSYYLCSFPHDGLLALPLHTIRFWYLSLNSGNVIWRQGGKIFKILLIDRSLGSLKGSVDHLSRWQVERLNIYQMQKFLQKVLSHGTPFMFAAGRQEVTLAHRALWRLVTGPVATTTECKRSRWLHQYALSSRMPES